MLYLPPIATFRIVYTDCQHHCYDNSAVTLAILFSLKTMEPLQHRVSTHFQTTPLFAMRTESLASSQSYREVETDTWCLTQCYTRRQKTQNKSHFWHFGLTLTFPFVVLVLTSCLITVRLEGLVYFPVQETDQGFQ